MLKDFYFSFAFLLECYQLTFFLKWKSHENNPHLLDLLYLGLVQVLYVSQINPHNNPWSRYYYPDFAGLEKKQRTFKEVA